MLRISETGTLNQIVTLKLEGNVAGPWVAELRKACDSLLSEGRALRLDLAEVEFLDRTGTTVIASLKLRGVFLENCSPFITEQLRNS
jgi:anti-anti-sigma regulatory factor